MIEKYILIGALVGSVLATYYILRRYATDRVSVYQQKLESVVNSDQNKVKGRFD